VLVAEAPIPECSGGIADRAEEVTWTIAMPSRRFLWPDGRYSGARGKRG
jgi:hypothetical protein